MMLLLLLQSHKCCPHADSKTMTIDVAAKIYHFYSVHVIFLRKGLTWGSGRKGYGKDFSLTWILVIQWVSATTRTIRRRPCHRCTIAFPKGAHLWTFWKRKRNVTVLVRLRPELLTTLTMPKSPHLALPDLTLVLFLRQSPPSPGHPGPWRGSEDLRLVSPPEQTGGPAGHFESQPQALVWQVQWKWKGGWVQWLHGGSRHHPWVFFPRPTPNTWSRVD